MTRRKSLEPTSEKAIEDALVRDLDIDHLKVYLIKGVPHIEGSVSGWRDKRRATEIVSSLARTTHIVNRLRVVPHATRRDEAVASAARNCFRTLPNLGLARAEVSCRDGVVELTGDVESWAARRSAEKAIRSIRGVVSIRNRLRLKGVDMPVRQLEGEIKKALRECLSLETAAIEVRFEGGTVKLLGTVPSPYHRLAAEDLVRWFSSVQDVANGLSIKKPLPLSEDAETIRGQEPTTSSA